MKRRGRGGARPGAGRPTKGKELMVSRSLRLEPSLIKRIEAHAKKLSAETGLSVGFADRGAAAAQGGARPRPQEALRKQRTGCCSRATRLRWPSRLLAGRRRPNGNALMLDGLAAGAGGTEGR